MRAKIFYSKHGGEKLLSIWWLFVIIIVAGGIVWGVAVFSAGEANVKKIEADILNKKIESCLFEQGFLISGLLEDDFDIFRKCSLNREVIESDFYFKVSIEGKEITARNFQTCSLEDAEKKGCVKTTRTAFYEKDGELKKGELEIWTSSHQSGRRGAE